MLFRLLITTAVLLDLVLLPGCAKVKQGNSFDLAANLRLLGWDYQPNKLTIVVNSLKSSGKAEAFASLQKYAGSSAPDLYKDQNIQVICMLLFERPSGWSPMRGLPEPYLSDRGQIAFPQFPIAFSKGIPFLLVTGYRIGGGGPKYDWVLRECRGLDLAGEHIVLCTRDEAIDAAQALITSEAFKHLYRDDEQLAIAQSFVLGQARRTDIQPDSPRPK